MRASLRVRYFAYLTRCTHSKGVVKTSSYDYYAGHGPRNNLSRAVSEIRDCLQPEMVGQRRDHSTIIYPLLRRLAFIRKGTKLFGRVPRKYVSTYTKAAGLASEIKFNSLSKVDNLRAYCKIKKEITNKKIT